MMWKECYLLERKKTGTDALGNDTYDFQEVMMTACRFSPWTNDQIALEGRDVTTNEQQYVVPIPYFAFPSCQKAEIDGMRREITQVIDLSPRYTMIRVRSYKE